MFAPPLSLRHKPGVAPLNSVGQREILWSEGCSPSEPRIWVYQLVAKILRPFGGALIGILVSWSPYRALCLWKPLAWGHHLLLRESPSRIRLGSASNISLAKAASKTFPQAEMELCP